MTSRPQRLKPIGFWSYARQDDEASDGRLSQLRGQLARELQQVYGRQKIQLWQDVAAIPPGAEWDKAIDEAIAQSTFLIPIITPAFVESEFCCREVAKFFEREKEINAAYFAKVKTWHPDRLPPELEPLRGHAETIFHHLTEAQKTLLNPQLSARYRRSVQDGGGTPADERKLAKVLEAAVTFQKAEVLMRRKAWAEAAPVVDEALELRPKEPDYLAARAEVLLRLKGSEGLHLRELRDHLMQALDAAPEHERALMVKAELAARRNDHTEALRLYEQVAQRYPKNIDAVRQVRIARMRKGGDRSGSHESEEAGSGLLGKLFGRKKK